MTEQAAATNTGFLAIWSDIAAEHETDYLHWLTREHTAERLGVDGFAAVRVYRSLQRDVRRFFIRYELRSPAVVASEAYLARLNAPTPWTQRIMPRLGNFMRGGGRVLAEAGVGHGGIVAVLRLDELPPGSPGALVQRLSAQDRIVRAELLQTDAEATSIDTNEKSLRGRDKSFAGLLLIEGADERAVAATVASAGHQAAGNLYAQIFQL
jgi:hypothetical protein